MKKALIVGASRGLGNAVVRFLPEHLEFIDKLTVISRNGSKICLRGLEVTNFISDISRTEDQEAVCKMVQRDSFDLVVYCAGGGPHGEFGAKEWKDHRWALDVGLLAPMKICHAWLASPSIGKFVIVGSRIAEQAPDPLAASYAAAKHGLIGFVSSLQDELTDKKVWLFSPGYMDSELLPRTAKVRHDGSKLMSVDAAAQALLRWVKKDGPWHRVLN